MTLPGALLVGSLAAVGVIGTKLLRRAGRSRVGALRGAGFLVCYALAAWMAMAYIGSLWTGSFPEAATNAAWAMPFLIGGGLWVLSRGR